MSMRKLNWQLWAGFLLSVAAVLSYPLFFVRFPVTRDFPWINLFLFALAVLLLFVGVRRAFAAGLPHPARKKIVASIAATLGLVVIGLFIFSFFIMARWLPASQGAPQVGQKAPDFTLTDTHGKNVSLAELLTSPGPGEIDSAAGKVAVPATQKGVLLVFYRGHW